MTAEFFDRSLGGDDTPGGRMSLARDALDLSVGEVARIVGVEDDTLRYWENDQAEPRANKLTVLAGVLLAGPARPHAQALRPWSCHALPREAMLLHSMKDPEGIHLL
jgi:transcriptional regulator with XRE-family HTH domain